MPNLVPDYLSIDYSTIINRLKTQLRQSETFVDYNYEGANITILMELLAYIGELNVYFMNKIAQNIHIETADVYEMVNKNARQMGYEPQGPISARGTVTVTVTAGEPYHEYRLYEFTQMISSDEYAGENIQYANTTTYSITPTASDFEFDIEAFQGVVVNLEGYTGKDLIDNELLLPDNYSYDNTLGDEYPTIILTVNGLQWERVSDFYDELSTIRTGDNVYMFVYDRYRRGKIVFNSARNVPTRDDTLVVKVLKSLGVNGVVGAGTIVGLPSRFLYDITAASWVNNEKINIFNSNATFGAADAEGSDSIKQAARSRLHAQFRNVTAVDYKSDLERRADVIVANAWGEQDISPSGTVGEFNRVHLSVVPSDWGPETINYRHGIMTTPWDASGSIMIPSGYNPEYEGALKLHVEPRKIISTYEVMELPELIYFTFTFGIRRKRLYDFDKITTDLKEKLDYYFRADNQKFNSEINYNDIIEFIVDDTKVSDDSTFSNIRGIRNINLRDIEVSAKVWEPNVSNLFPQYIEPSATYFGENQLRKIRLGFNQFPVLQLDTVLINEET